MYDVPSLALSFADSMLLILAQCAPFCLHSLARLNSTRSRRFLGLTLPSF